MKIFPYMNKLLSKKYIQDLINEEKFRELYAQLPEEVPNLDHIGGLTKLLLAAGINPLNNLNYIPSNYLIASDINNFSMPNNIRIIKSMSFAYCNNLKSITFPANLEVIGDAAFYSCKSLNNVVIPGNVKTIEQDAFRYCDSLKNVTIEKGVQEIGRHAFDNCPLLQYITYTGTVEDLKKINMDFSDILNSTNIKCADGEIGV